MVSGDFLWVTPLKTLTERNIKSYSYEAQNFTSLTSEMKLLQSCRFGRLEQAIVLLTERN
jgi:hypothetical protein